MNMGGNGTPNYNAKYYTHLMVSYAIRIRCGPYITMDEIHTWYIRR